MANRYMKRWLTSLIVWEMQIKTTMGCQLTSAGMPSIKREEITSVSKDMEERGLSCTDGRDVN